MGPILSIKNKLVENFQLNDTFEEEFNTIIQVIKEKVISLFPSSRIILVPSTDDVTNFYPIPQQ